MADKALKPQPGPQTEFYNSDADITIMVGGCGAGKTTALLMDILRPEWTEKPNYWALFRREKKSFYQPGGILDQINSNFPGVSSTGHLFSLPKNDDHLKFGACEFNRVGIDELGEFEEDQFFYLLSRCRKSADGVKWQVKATLTLDENTPKWITDWLEPIMDSGFGSLSIGASEYQVRIILPHPITPGLIREEPI